jgi:hypothetical protein
VILPQLDNAFYYYYFYINEAEKNKNCKIMAGHVKVNFNGDLPLTLMLMEMTNE